MRFQLKHSIFLSAPNNGDELIVKQTPMLLFSEIVHQLYPQCGDSCKIFVFIDLSIMNYHSMLNLHLNTSVSTSM